MEDCILKDIQVCMDYIHAGILDNILDCVLESVHDCLDGNLTLKQDFGQSLGIDMIFIVHVCFNDTHL